MVQKRTELQEGDTLSTQPLETDFPGCVNRPSVVVDILYIVVVFLQKRTATLTIHLEISIKTTFSLEYIRPGLHHSERKIPELLSQQSGH